jgi:hypothetical protein
LRACNSVFYTDTDSLFTYDLLPTDTRLGSLKLEGVYSQVEFKGNKLYCVDETVRAKGVPRNKAKEFFDSGKASFRRPIKFKEGRKRGLQPNVWIDTTKENVKVYTKRKIYKNGVTVPWQLQEYRRFIHES